MIAKKKDKKQKNEKNILSFDVEAPSEAKLNELVVTAVKFAN